MRVGCSRKTKDGLLDIWTSAPDYISMRVGGDLLMCLRLKSVSVLQTAKEYRVSICELFYGEEEINQKANICL